MEIVIHCSHDEVREIAELVPNHHPLDQIEMLAAIIKATGCRQPITVSKRSGFIVKGHGRYEAAKILGCPPAPQTCKTTRTRLKSMRIWWPTTDWPNCLDKNQFPIPQAYDQPRGQTALDEIEVQAWRRQKSQ